MRKGDLDKAVPHLERGVMLCQTMGIPFMFPWLASLLGSAHALSGRLAEAFPLLEQAVEATTQMSVVAMRSLAVCLQGEAYLLGGRRDDVLRLAETALDLARSDKERGYEAWTLRLLGEIQSSGESPDRPNGEPYYRRAIALATELGMRPLVAHYHLGLGKLYGRTRPRQDARQPLAEGTAMYREMEMQFWLERAEGGRSELY